MASIRSRLISGFVLPWISRRLDFEKASVDQLRRGTRSVPVPFGTVVEKTVINNLAAEWIRASNVSESTDCAILYLHGGGFTIGSCASHRGLAARISRASGVKVLLVEYRLAPENRFPAANHDCVAAYHWLLENGFFSKNIMIGGDSAGGGLTLMTLMALRDAGDPLPAGAFLLSPWIEMLQFDGASYQSRKKRDPFITLGSLKRAASYYLNVWVKLPILMPLQQNLSELPKLLIQVGDEEVLLSDAERLAERVRESGGEAILEIWDKMWHVFHLFAPLIPESNQAIKNIGSFVRKQLRMKSS